jgi:hypothetical protein
VNKLLNLVRFSLLFFSTFICTQRTLAIDFEDAVFPELATSARALAMGNAYLCLVDDAAAAWYNPAGLGTVRNTHFHLSNIHLEANKGWFRSGSNGRAEDAASNLPKGLSLDGARELAIENPGVISSRRFHILPNFTTRFFTAGFLYSKNTRTYLGGDPTSEFEYADRTDYGPYAGLNISLFGGIIKAGVSGIFLSRKEAQDSVDRNTTIELEDDDYKKGRAFVLTAGARVTLPIALLPTFAANMHNAGSSEFTSSGAGAPTKIEQSVDLGFSITPMVSNYVRLHLEANLKDSAQMYKNTPATRKLVFGMEIDIARTMFFRLGYGDGFGSGGLGIKTQSLEFDLTTYAVDTSSALWRGKEDRRFAMSISSGF